MKLKSFPAHCQYVFTTGWSDTTGRLEYYSLLEQRADRVDK